MNSVLERPIWTAGEKIKDRGLLMARTGSE